MINVNPPYEHAPLSSADDEPPDLLITTQQQEQKILWNEDAVLASVLPALAHGYQYMKVDFPALNQMEISLLLSDDQTITTLNKQWRNQEKPTNVLSFAQFSYEQLTSGKHLNADDFLGLGILAHQTGVAMKYPLGDIVLSFETCQKEAQASNIDFYHHTTHLFIHGFLHLLGYDHEDDKDAEKMQQTEIAILQKCDIANPYHEKSSITPNHSHTGHHHV